MVRSSIDCKAGLDAFKESYPEIAKADSSIGVLDEWYATRYLEPEYLANLHSGVDARWRNEHSGQSVREAIRQALMKGFGEPVLNLITSLSMNTVVTAYPQKWPAVSLICLSTSCTPTVSRILGIGRQKFYRVPEGN